MIVLLAACGEEAPVPWVEFEWAAEPERELDGSFGQTTALERAALWGAEGERCACDRAFLACRFAGRARG